MIEQVNSLIRNKLCKKESLYLPSIGSLIFSHVGAKRLSSKQIATPHNKITFSGEERGESLVDIIAAIAAIPSERAMSIYEQWQQQTTKDNVVTIAGVGTIENRQFKPDAEFAKVMNLSPKSEVVRLHPRSNYLFYAIATISILIAVGSALYIVDSEQKFSQRMDKESVVQRDITAAAADTPVEPQRITATVCTEPRKESSATDVQPTATPQTAESQAAAVSSSEPIDMTMSYSYAVWGVYGELSNAKRYLDWLQKNYADLQSNIYNYKGRYMVAVYAGKSRKEVATALATLKAGDDHFADVWIYTNK